MTDVQPDPLPETADESGIDDDVPAPVEAPAAATAAPGSPPNFVCPTCGYGYTGRPDSCEGCGTSFRPPAPEAGQ